jgi:cysteine-rich repeat protein
MTKLTYCIRAVPPLGLLSLVFAIAACSNPSVVNQGGEGSAGSGHGGGSGGGGGMGGIGGGGGITIPPVPDAGPELSGPAHCGDGILNGGEQCDDGNTEGDDGCSKSCQTEANWSCPDEGQPCVNEAVCGNGKLTSDEICDDNNTKDGDGCSADCQKIEDGYICPVPGKPCLPQCGDSKKSGGEACDDGNTANGDGCSTTCQVEPGWSCTGTPSTCKKAVCGNGVTETGESCDCGTDAKNLPSGCPGINGLFYGNGKGCSKTCTKEPSCQDASGKTQACSSTCGDGNIDPDETCDDGNQTDGDGCSSKCKVEDGFTCNTVDGEDSATCQSGAGKCLQLPIIYRDFQPENVASGGHPDFFYLGTRYNGAAGSTTTCVPNSGGPSKGNDSTKRCWGIAADTLLKGKPQPGKTTTCECQYSEWSVGNANQIAGGYLQSESPLYTGNGLTGPYNTVSTTGPYVGIQNGSTQTGGPIFKGTTPAYKDAASFNQWFNDDPKVNKTFTSVLELSELPSPKNVFHYASTSHLNVGGFFPLDTLNPSQATLCNLWPYWHAWPMCASPTNQQYLFPPRVVQADCPLGTLVNNGCWVTAPGVTHDSWFTDEVRYYFVYNPDTGISLSFFGDDDLFIFINGVLVLDLGGVHQQLPGRVTVKGDPGKATILEGGCLRRDPSGAQSAPGADGLPIIVGTTATSKECSPTNSTTVPGAASLDDFRSRTVDLNLEKGRVYEIAIFGADRHPPESNYELTLSGYTTKHSACQPRCGDGVVTGGEQCDCGDGKGTLPDGCTGPNNDTTYGGCKTNCKWGPFCGDGEAQKDPDGPEQCDLGKDNGDTSLGPDGCTFGCTIPHFCGDKVPDPGEECDLGDMNGVRLDSGTSTEESSDPNAPIWCNTDCTLPTGVIY